MKPHRLAMTNSLVMHYGLHKQMDVLVPHRATISDMAAFHDEEYLRFLQAVTPDNQVQTPCLQCKVPHAPPQRKMLEDVKTFALAKSDCPVFYGMYTLAQVGWRL